VLAIESECGHVLPPQPTTSAITGELSDVRSAADNDCTLGPAILGSIDLALNGCSATTPAIEVMQEIAAELREATT
jgi:hypothetical protein